MANSLKHQSNKQSTFTSQKRNILVVSICGSCLILLHVAFAFVSISYVLGIFHLYLNPPMFWVFQKSQCTCSIPKRICTKIWCLFFRYLKVSEDLYLYVQFLRIWAQNPMSSCGDDNFSRI